MAILNLNNLGHQRLKRIVEVNVNKIKRDRIQKINQFLGRHDDSKVSPTFYLAKSGKH
jgi:phage protein U